MNRTGRNGARANLKVAERVAREAEEADHARALQTAEEAVEEALRDYCCELCCCPQRWREAIAAAERSLTALG